jgi:hypothetical protein
MSLLVAIQKCSGYRISKWIRICRKTLKTMILKPFRTCKLLILLQVRINKMSLLDFFDRFSANMKFLQLLWLMFTLWSLPVFGPAQNSSIRSVAVGLRPIWNHNDLIWNWKVLRRPRIQQLQMKIYTNDRRERSESLSFPLISGCIA